MFTEKLIYEDNREVILGYLFVFLNNQKFTKSIKDFRVNLIFFLKLYFFRINQSISFDSVPLPFHAECGSPLPS